MSALTKARATGSRRILDRDYRPLAANAKVFKGGIAIVLLAGAGMGYYQQGAAGVGVAAVAVGRFYEDADNTGGVNGAISAQIEFLRDRKVMLLNNDTGTPVAVTDRESPCQVLDDQTVTKAVGTVAAGTVYDVTSEGVWVEVDEATISALTDAAGLSNIAPVNPTSAAAIAGVAASASRQDHKHQIPLATPTNEGLMSAAYAVANSAPVANSAALVAIAAANRGDGMVVMCLDDFSFWRFSAASAAAADTTGQLVRVPAAGTGRWLRADDVITLTIPIDFTKADGAVLYTLPTGARLHPREAWHDVAVNWTGGAASAIGVSTNVAGFNTAGDILGGAGGDVAATLVTTNTRMTGTIGAKLATRTLGRLILLAGDTLNFNRIVSAFTAGSGNVRVLCDVIANIGA